MSSDTENLGREVPEPGVYLGIAHVSQANEMTMSGEES